LNSCLFFALRFGRSNCSRALVRARFNALNSSVVTPPLDKSRTLCLKCAGVSIRIFAASALFFGGPNSPFMSFFEGLGAMV